jgi:hypothetical protein
MDTKKTMTYINPDPGLGQAEKCGRIKPVHGILPLDTWGSPSAIHTQTIKNLPRVASSYKDHMLYITFVH